MKLQATTKQSTVHTVCTIIGTPFTFGPLLITGINVNASMDKYSYPLQSSVWNCLSTNFNGVALKFGNGKVISSHT